MRMWHVVCEKKIVFSSRFYDEAFNWFHTHCGVDYPRGMVVSDDNPRKQNLLLLPKSPNWVDGDQNETQNMASYG